MLKIKNKILKPLSTLPKNGVCYRVDAVGLVSMNPYSPTNHLVDIVVSPLLGAISHKDDFINLNNIKSDSQECYQVSLGEAYVYQPGTVIKNGEILSRPSGPDFDEVIHADPDKIRFIPADLAFNTNGKKSYLIPPYIYKMGPALRSTLIAIEKNGDPYAILVPAMEVLRYFYFSSSFFNQRIFSSDMDDFEVATTRGYNFDKENRRLTICLRKNYPDADAIIIGSLLTNSHARDEIKKVWASFVNHTSQNKTGPLPPVEIGFPVTGNIRIQAKSVALPSPHNDQKRKLLTTLLACHYSLPFSHIELQRENFGSRGDNDAHEDKPRPHGETERKKIIWPNDVIEPSEGQNNPFSTPTALLDRAFIDVSANRFPLVKVEKVSQSGEGSTRVIPSSTPCPTKVANQSTSDSTSGQSNSAPISIVPKEKSDPEEYAFAFADFSSFIHICEGLLKSPHIKEITSVIINGIDKHNLRNISHFPTLCGMTKLTWAVIFHNDFQPRTRQLSIQKVRTLSGAIIYLMEIERREKTQAKGIIKTSNKKKDETKDKFSVYMFANETRSEISQSDLGKLLLKLARSHFKGYKKIFTDCGFTIASRKHIGTIDDCVNAILSKIFGIFKD